MSENIRISLGHPVLIFVYSMALLLIGCAIGMHWYQSRASAIWIAVAAADVEVDNHSFRSAASVICFSHVGAFHVEKNAASPWFPYSKEHLVFNLASIASNHFNGEEVAVSALLALVRRQLRDNAREQFRKFLSTGVENAACSIIVETQRQIVRASVSRKAACEAMMAKRDVDAKLLG